MSHQKAKLARKFIKNYLKKKELMDTPNKVQFTFGQLQNYIQLAIFLTGKKPDKIELVEAYYNWFLQEANNQVEVLGFKNELKDGKVTFMGIPLEKKVTIVTPEVVKPKANGKV
jgi:hypothetical protein